ncbi:MAG: threonine--tRNA ligase, partial [Oscillospiraceae bacterium]|nr:threonine--tRNA ligase [Oscillospiraceae bacterium]
PVVLHRAILGSLDRFMAYLIEETMGQFPTWLAPVQVKVLTITDRTNEFADSIASELNALGLRAEADLRNEKIGYKIREAQSQKVPYMLVIGDKEAEAGEVSVRNRAGKTVNLPKDEFIARLMNEVKTKSRELTIGE